MVVLVSAMAAFFALGAVSPAVSRINTRLATGKLSIDCDRARGTCTVRTVGSLATWGGDYLGTPIAHIQKAEVVDVPDRAGAVRLVLRTPEERRLSGDAIDPAEQAAMRAAADRVNAFLADPTAAHMRTTCPYGSAPNRGQLVIALAMLAILGFVVFLARMSDRRRA